MLFIFNVLLLDTLISQVDIFRNFIWKILYCWNGSVLAMNTVFILKYWMFNIFSITVKRKCYIVIIIGPTLYNLYHFLINQAIFTFRNKNKGSWWDPRWPAVYDTPPVIKLLILSVLNSWTNFKQIKVKLLKW